MRTKISVNKYGQIYIPSQIRKELGVPDEENGDLYIIGDLKTFLIVPKNLPAKDILRSLEVITKHVEHEAEIEEMKKNDK